MRMLVTEPIDLIQRRDPARPLFAIGDIHGHADALEAMLSFLDAYFDRTYKGQKLDLVYLGDLIDRGPDSLRCLQLAQAGLGRDDVRETALIGNHDSFLCVAAELGGMQSTDMNWDVWMANGGAEAFPDVSRRGPLASRAAELRDILGADLCAFLEEMPIYFQSENVFCVHAGVEPEAPLDEQDPDELIWIREPFLSRAADETAPWPFEKLVVHGHTPNAFGAFTHRIGVDSGGFSTGVFTAAEIWDGQLRFHHLRR